MPYWSPEDRPKFHIITRRHAGFSGRGYSGTLPASLHVPKRPAGRNYRAFFGLPPQPIHRFRCLIERKPHDRIRDTPDDKQTARIRSMGVYAFRPDTVPKSSVCAARRGGKPGRQRPGAFPAMFPFSDRPRPRLRPARSANSDIDRRRSGVDEKRDLSRRILPICGARQSLGFTCASLRPSARPGRPVSRAGAC